MSDHCPVAATLNTTIKVEKDSESPAQAFAEYLGKSVITHTADAGKGHAKVEADVSCGSFLDSEGKLIGSCLCDTIEKKGLKPDAVMLEWCLKRKEG